MVCNPRFHGSNGGNYRCARQVGFAVLLLTKHLAARGKCLHGVFLEASISKVEAYMNQLDISGTGTIIPVPILKKLIMIISEKSHKNITRTSEHHRNIM